MPKRIGPTPIYVVVDVVVVAVVAVAIIVVAVVAVVAVAAVVVAAVAVVVVICCGLPPSMLASAKQLDLHKLLSLPRLHSRYFEKRIA